MAEKEEPEGMDYSIEVSGLWKIFGPNPEKVMNSDLKNASKEELAEKTGCFVAVRDVSFKVECGEFFVLMGLSGSGKSTVIRLIMRLIEPTAGKVIINGEDIRTYDDKQLQNLRRKTTGMVFQYFGLFPHYNVLDNVALGLELRGVPKEERYARAFETIETVGLKGWENYLPGALSGGMQQRVGIARALVTDPEILFMDEPFSGLDPLIRREMQDELLDILSEVKKTIVFVTHDLDEALKLGNHIAIMRNGEIIQIGTPEEVITTPTDAYVSEFVQDASLAKVVSAQSVMKKPRSLLYEWQGPKAALQTLKDKDMDYAFVVTKGRKLLGQVTLDNLVELIRKKQHSLKDTL